MLSRGSLAVALIAAASAWGQSVISAHSGVIHLAEGQVTVDDKDVRQKFGEFGDVRTGQVLTTQDGRAEVLLTPGVFLRVNENSSFRMVRNKLDDTKIEVLSGTAMVQVSELLQDNAITLMFHDASIALMKKGLYRVDAEQGALRVYEGEAAVTSAAKNLTVKKGREVALNDQLTAKSFDAKDTDAFYRWNERRDEYIAEANVYAAKSARDQGFGYTNTASSGGYGTGMGSWAFNPWFGMFTYMPYSGMYYSPFGYGYFSPYSVGYLYMPGSPYYYSGGGGTSRAGLVSTGSSTGIGSITRNSPTLVGGGTGATRGTGTGTTGGVGFGGAHGGGPSLGGGSGSSGSTASSGGHSVSSGGGAGHASGGAHR
jgi:hypothetical protein